MRPLLLVLALLVGCDGPAGGSCTTDLDCGSGFRCLDGTCEDRPAFDGGPDASSCRAGEVRCGDACANPLTSPVHCGGCGTPCGSLQTCMSGMCEGGCAGGELACGATCVDPQTDAMHCGDCDTACDASELCADGACVPRCTPTDPSTEVCDGVDNDCDGSVDLAGCGVGLVAWYRFEETDGAVIDSSGRGHHGEAMGAAARGPDGWVGGALSLDGALASMVVVPDHEDFAFGSAFTAEAWVNTETCTPAGADHDTIAVIESGFLFAFMPTCQLSSYVYSTSAGTWLNDRPIASLVPGRWMHVTMSWDGVTLTTYLDGTQVGTGSAAPGPMNDAASPLRIGSRADCCTQTFQGRIDELKLWNVARGPAEVCADAGGTFDASRGTCTL